MADDALPVTWSDFEPFVGRFNGMEKKINTIERRPTQAPSSDMISAYQTPWIVQNYYLPHSNHASQEHPPSSPSGPKA
jgi:hypothetical protein